MPQATQAFSKVLSRKAALLTFSFNELRLICSVKRAETFLLCESVENTQAVNSQQECYKVIASTPLTITPAPLTALWLLIYSSATLT